MQTTDIYIVDDHAVVRDGIKMMLVAYPEIAVTGEFENGKELFEALKSKEPDLLLLDITLPGLTGIEIAKIITESYPKLKILILSAMTDRESITESIKAGAHGFLSKDVQKEELHQAIIAVHKNKRYVGSNIALTVFEGFISSISKESIIEDQLLTDREIEIIKLFSDGLLYKQIADKLGISIKTVESHKANIMRKLELKSTVELVKYAIKNKLIDL